MQTDTTLADYKLLTGGAAYVPLESPTIIRLTGNDRQSLLHNFCTADIKGLAAGHVTEAFVLNTKGKLLGHVHVIAGAEELLLFTVPGQFAALHEHLDRYIIREDVQIADASAEFECVFVAGNHTGGKLSTVAGVLPGRNECRVLKDSTIAMVARLELAGFGYLILCQAGQRDALTDELQQAGIPGASSEALEIVRIENGTPHFGIDSSEANLPQELQRNEQAISFDKGCYLGQETVARIDAMGHVNQLLAQLEFNNPAESGPQVGDELAVEEKKVGTVTSVCWSPEQELWVGLGYVKRAHAKDGTTLSAGENSCTVIV